MRKARNSKLALLLVLTMLATLFVAIPTASAACDYSMTFTKTVKAGNTYSTTLGEIGALVIDMDPTVATSVYNKYVYLSLPSSPSGYKLEIESLDGSCVINDKNPGSIVNNIKVTQTNPRTVQVKFLENFEPEDLAANVKVKLPLKVTIPSGASGDIILKAEAPSSSVFSSGDIVIARAGTASVSLSVESVPSISSSGGQIGVIRIKEGVDNTLKDSGQAALKLKLPSGFKWTSAPSVEPLWGELNEDNIEFKITNDDRTLEIHVDADHKGSYFKLIGNVEVDESVAKTGEVKVTVSGATTASPSELVVANYGEEDVTVNAFGEVPTITAGKQGSDIAKLEIAEAVPGSLIDNRTITLTLPDNVKWSQGPNIDEDNSQNRGDLGITARIVGSDSKMLKITISGDTSTQTDPAKLVLKDMQVTPAVDFSGDLTVEIAGSQGVEGQVTLAKVVAPVSATASSTPDVKIGYTSQVAGDITIVENQAEAIKGVITYSDVDDDGYVVSGTNTDTRARIVVKAPAGVTFTDTPTVEVVEGDLQLVTGGVSTTTSDAGEGLLYIKVKSDSSTPSKIKISGIKLTVDRTVPEGPIYLSIRGNAIDETLDEDGNDELYPGHLDAAKVAVANCVTPGAAQTKGSAVFTLGSASYTLNGSTVSMPVAPYAKNGRTYLPLRFCGNAIGIDDANIWWDGATKTATLKKDNTIVQVKLGSQALYVNGVQVATMDVAPEAKDGYTMLPIRPVLEAFGAKVTYDAATQAISIEY